VFSGGAKPRPLQHGQRKDEPGTGDAEGVSGSEDEGGSSRPAFDGIFSMVCNWPVCNWPPRYHWYMQRPPAKTAQRQRLALDQRAANERAARAGEPLPFPNP